VRVGGGPGLDVVFNDGPSVPERQRTRKHLGGKHLAVGEIGLDSNDLGDEPARARRLVRLDDNPAAVGERCAGDAADARLVEQSPDDVRAEMASTERVDRRGDGARILAR
jgi:hypothetical protein